MRTRFGVWLLSCYFCYCLISGLYVQKPCLIRKKSLISKQRSSNLYNVAIYFGFTAWFVSDLVGNHEEKCCSCTSSVLISGSVFLFLDNIHVHVFCAVPGQKTPSCCLAKAQADTRCLIALLWYLLGLYRTWSETTMLNIATEHANMISLFIIRFLDSITNVSESKF